ncbi:hypothetical protein NPIL_289231 [Nephila pilipes]|uniref:Uncharacterized protein n=1 Tax=Nephila pilipes TaxID=299642 RepID=A0A8X6QHD8_NEPPI|nr:hypothetical protein NPIL_289231 [Nephila pilipes]
MEVLKQLSVLSSDDEDYLCGLDEGLLNTSDEKEEYFSIMRRGVAEYVKLKITSSSSSPEGKYKDCLDCSNRNVPG